jgi:hypothetical protein
MTRNISLYHIQGDVQGRVSSLLPAIQGIKAPGFRSRHRNGLILPALNLIRLSQRQQFWLLQFQDLPAKQKV